MKPNLHQRIKQQKESLQDLVGLLCLGRDVDPDVELKEIEGTIELLEEIEKLLG